jgi:predicted kinase
MENIEKKQKKVFLLCGVPGSGKSTWARNHLTKNTEWISRDKVRFSIIKDNEEYFSHEEEVFNAFIAYINWALNEDSIDTIYIDATHINTASRRKVLKKIQRNCISELNCVCFVVPLETCIERNSQRDGMAYVPESVIERMYNSYFLPTSNEPFNWIYIVDENGKIKTIMMGGAIPASGKESNGENNSV